MMPTGELICLIWKNFIDLFSLESRWAVSAVSTRQNNILNDRGEPQLALIPVMDFLNHQTGRECIHYLPDTRQIECRTMKNIEDNEQIFMFYGKRTNAEYFIHNGFVPNEPNPYDTYILKLGMMRFLFVFRTFLVSKLFQRRIKHSERKLNCYNVMD